MLKRKRSCAQRCWMAKNPKCRCICEGKSHGIWHHIKEKEGESNERGNEKTECGD